MRGVAAVVVLLLHLGFYLVLARGPQGPARPDAAPTSMRVEFIDRPADVDIVVEDAIAREADASREPGPRRRPVPAAPADPAAARATDPGQAPLRLEWREGNGFDAPRVPPPADGAPVAVLDAPAPERFRMREPVKGKDVIEGTARAIGLWPEGYTTDPCPRIRSNIGGLMTDTRPEARQALQEELRRRRAACGR